MKQNAAMEQALIQNGRQLVLEFLGESHASGGLLGRVPVTYSDLQLARDETWWSGVCKGSLGPSLEKYEVRVVPGPDAGDGKRDGYDIELSNGETSFRRHFDIHSLADKARRVVAELVASKAVNGKETVRYYMTTVPAAEASGENAWRNSHRGEPPIFERARLADFLEASQPLLGATDPPEPGAEPAMPIFTKPEAWQEGQEHAFRGGEDESAAMFSGRVFEDTESPQKFICIDACLEAAGCEETPTSVEFTGETWASLRALLDLRRRRLNVPHEIIVASVHRHPFLPGTDAAGRRMCDVCSTRRYCSRSTAVPSADDFEWHRAVFTGQPFCTLLIWGYTARGEEDFRLYGLRNGTLQQREIRLLNW